MRTADQLRNAIQSCSLCIFFATKNSLESSWCHAEIGAFWGASKPVLIYGPDKSLQTEKLPKQFQGDLWKDDPDELIKSLHATLFPEGRLGTPDKRGRGTIAMLPNTPRYNDPEKKNAIQTAIKNANLKEEVEYIHHFEKLDDSRLALWKGLFLMMPYGVNFSPAQIDRLVRWVRQGGRLVLCGYELGPWHHRTNVNAMAAEFGLRFRSDAVIEEGGEVRGKTYKAYNQELPFTNITAPDHSLMRDVTEVCLRNCCSLDLEPGSQVLLKVTPNQIRELTPNASVYTPDATSQRFQLAPAYQEFSDPVQNPHRAIIAEGPSDLSGKGSVIAIGTWDFRTGTGKNDAFLRNLFVWLTGSA